MHCCRELLTRWALLCLSLFFDRLTFRELIEAEEESPQKTIHPLDYLFFQPV